jgi:adenine phosphoribosyltransferase
MILEKHIRTIPDYPSVGIQYRDISPVLYNSGFLSEAIDYLHFKVKTMSIDMIVGIEGRGLIFASPLALKLGVGMTEARKRSSIHPAKIPGRDYAIELGTNRVEIMQDAIKRGKKVLIVDDVLATGETALATAKLVQEMGGEVIAFAFLADINYYEGKEKLQHIAPVIYIYDC